MGAIRLDDDQLARLSAGLLEEQREVMAAALAMTDGRPSVRRLLRFVIQGKPDIAVGYRAATARTDASVAAWARVDRELAALELSSVRAQVPTLYRFASSWAREGDALDAQKLFERAVEALTRFYFGAPTADRLLLAETQLVWLAERTASQLLPLSRRMRERRRTALRRYRILWDEWARGQAAAPTT